MDFEFDPAKSEKNARERGLLVNRTNEKVVRMLPPLTIEASEIDRAVDILDEVFATVEAEVHA